MAGHSDVAGRSLIEVVLKDTSIRFTYCIPDLARKKRSSLTSPRKLATQSSFMKSIRKGLRGFNLDTEAGPSLSILNF